MNRVLLVCTIVAVSIAGFTGFTGCAAYDDTAEESSAIPTYFDFRTPGDFQAGGVQMIDLEEGYKVWTKRFGNGPIKVLLLHGGPAATHEYMECFESFFPQVGIEFYHYDQLGSYRSDQPEDTSLWTIERFVDELQLRPFPPFRIV